MKGWRGRQFKAELKRRRNEEMAPIRRARELNRQREEAIARGEDPDEVPPQGVPASNKEGATPTPDYPNPDAMSRQEMIDYLKAHDVKGAHLMKDETLREKIHGGTETTIAP